MLTLAACAVVAGLVVLAVRLRHRNASRRELQARAAARVLSVVMEDVRRVVVGEPRRDP